MSRSEHAHHAQRFVSLIEKRTRHDKRTARRVHFREPRMEAGSAIQRPVTVAVVRTPALSSPADSGPAA
jgi:hypothetical protein